jgi:hypothetical protein
MYITTGCKGSLIIRGAGLNKAMAKTYGEYYLGTLNSTKPIDGATALLHSIQGIKILDIDDNSVL